MLGVVQVVVVVCEEVLQTLLYQKYPDDVHIADVVQELAGLQVVEEVQPLEDE